MTEIISLASAAINFKIITTSMEVKSHEEEMVQHLIAM
jgi:hypothetical protein